MKNLRSLTTAIRNLFSTKTRANVFSNDSSRSMKNSLDFRPLKMESLEERRLLSVTTAEYERIREEIPAFQLSENQAATNIIELTSLTATDLQNAIDQTSQTTSDDLIVVRTTAENQTITLEGNPIYISTNAETAGSIAIVSLSPDGSFSSLTIDTQNISNAFKISGGGDVSLANATILGTTWSFDADADYQGLIKVRNSTLNLISVDIIADRSEIAETELALASDFKPLSLANDVREAPTTADTIANALASGTLSSASDAENLSVSASPYGASQNDSTELMVGKVYVTLVLPQSNGSTDRKTETWTAGEINNVKREIRAGLDWWEAMFDKYNPDSQIDLTFTINFSYADSPVSTPYEPINRSSNDDYLWQHAFLEQTGYSVQKTKGGVFSGLKKYNDDQRIANNADWAYTIFVVDSSADADGMFPDGAFGYAYLGGPNVVLTYDNDGWGINRMEMVIAHETGHIFYALDEYAGEGTPGNYDEYSGYYCVQNTNAYHGNPNPNSRVDSIMADSDLQLNAYANKTSSAPSLQMLGWRDSDSDGIIDVLDKPLTLTDAVASYNAESKTFTFNGKSSVTMLDNRNPRGNGNDMTLNSVDSLQYKIDSGEWTTLTSYGTAIADVSGNVSVSSLSGKHSIAFRTACERTGVVSEAISFVFSVEVSATQLLPPNDLKANTVGKTEINVAWSEVADATKYRLAYSTSEDFLDDETSFVDFATAGSFLISGLNANTRYYFKIQSIGNETTTLSSIWSEIISQKTARDYSQAIIVDTLDDVVDANDGKTSLREAVASAIDGDVIAFDSSLAGKTIELTEGQLFLDNVVSIDAGNLWNETTQTYGLTISANGSGRSFEVAAGTRLDPVELVGISITGGSQTGDYFSNGTGGAIANTGTLYVQDCVFYENEANWGAAICNLGVLTVVDSLFYKNEGYAGGAIYNIEYGSVYLINSTVADNKADFGGGIFNDDSVSDGSATITIYNSIVAENSSSNGKDVYKEGTVQGFNNVSSFNAWNGTSGNNYIYSSSLPLFADAANGNYRLVEGSQALDKGNNEFAAAYGLTNASFDLGRESRISARIIDVGAYELQVEMSRLQSPVISAISATGATTVNVKWTTVPFASGYTLQYSVSEDFANAVSTTFSSSETHTIAGLTPETLYYFRVKADGTGRYLDSDWSATVEVQTEFEIIQLDSPVLTATPAGLNSIAVQWANVSNASGYLLQYSTDSTFATFSESPFATAGSHEILELALGTTYYFRAKSQGNERYSDSDWSATVSATTYSETIVLATPTISKATTLSSSAIKVSWNAVENASGYRLEYSTSEDFAASEFTDYVEAGSYSVSGLNRDATYYFRLKATGFGLYSDSEWSETVSAKTFKEEIPLAAPTILQTISQSHSVISVEWTEVANATGYVLQFSQTPSFVSYTQRTYETAGLYDVTNLDQNTRYYFRVSAVGGDVYTDSPWSNLASDVTRQDYSLLLIVTTAEDVVNRSDGVVSLREAVATAKPGETVTFAPELAGQTISLRKAELVINKGITIDATSLELKAITIDAGGFSRVFNLSGGSDAQPIQLLNLKLANGYSQYHGGIVKSSAVLRMDDVTLSYGTSYYGGAIYNTGSLTVLNSSLNYNAGTLGGAIYNGTTGSLALYGGSTNFNSAKDYGGVLYNAGIANLNAGVQMKNNSASYGSVAFNKSGSLSFDSAVISRNQATWKSAVYNDATLEMTNCSASLNGSYYGGFLYNNGTATLENCVATKNTGTLSGAVFNSSIGALTILTSEFTENVAIKYGGAIYNNGGTISVQVDSRFETNSANRGGAIYNNAGSVELTGTSFVNNDGRNKGGAIYNNDVLTIADSVVSDNYAIYGGGIFTLKSLTVVNCMIQENDALYGGGVYHAAGTSKITDGYVTGNSAYDGGGAFVRTGKLVVTNAKFLSNSATHNGGGIFNLSLTELYAATFSDNFATYYGGGVYNAKFLQINSKTSVTDNKTSIERGENIFNTSTGKTIVVPDTPEESSIYENYLDDETERFDLDLDLSYLDDVSNI